MMLEEHDQDEKCVENVHGMQDVCDAWLEELLSILKGGGVAVGAAAPADTGLADEMDKLRARIAQALTDGKAKDLAIEDLKKMLAEALGAAADHSALDAKNAESADLTKQLAQADAQIDALKKKLAEAANAAAHHLALDAKTAEMAELVKKLAAAEKDGADATRKIVDLDASVASKDETIEDLSLEFADMKKAHEAKMIDFQKKMEVLQITLHVLKSDVKSKQQDNEDLTKKLAALENDLGVVKKALEADDAQIKNDQSLIDVKETLIFAGKAEIEDLQRKLAALEKELAEAKVESTTLQRAIELINLTKEELAKEHLADHAIINKGEMHGTTVGVSYEDHTGTVSAVMVGGPAFNSKKSTQGRHDPCC